MWKYQSLVSMLPPEQLFSRSNFFSGRFLVPCPGWLLLDPSLYPCLALRQLKRGVGITEGKFSCKSCFAPTQPPNRPALRETGILNQLAMKCLSPDVRDWELENRSRPTLWEAVKGEQGCDIAEESGDL